MLAFLEMSSFDMRRGLPWVSLRSIVCDVIYGGKVSNALDRRILTAYGHR